MDRFVSHRMQQGTLSCPACGAPDDRAAARDGLVVHRSPMRVSFHGVWIDLTPLQAVIMEKLVQFGSAPIQALKSDGGAESLRVTIHHMRKRLPDAVRVEAIYGWGYLLRVDDGELGRITS